MGGTVEVTEIKDATDRLKAVCTGQIAKAKLVLPDVETVADSIWPKVAPTERTRENVAIRASKPKGDGRAAYVWRMLRFHLGEDVHMPVMADWDLSADLWEGVDGMYATREQLSEHHAVLKAETARLDAVVDFLLATRFPVRQFNAARVWGGAMGWGDRR